MLRPMLFVGCGGSGLRTLRRLRRELEYRLSVAGLGPEDFPSAWQFMAIDVPSSEQLDDAALREYGRGSYVGLADTQVGYSFRNGVDDQLINRPSTLDDFATWRPEPDKVKVDITKGAGQFRAVGRVVGAYSMNDKLVPKLRSAVGALGQVAATKELRRVAEALGVPDAQSGDILPPVAMIVSSLGGGAGSGVFIDVADAMRCMSAADGWLQRSVGILYDPSIFYTHDLFERGGIPPNSLAAVSELVAGHWNPWTEFPYIPSTADHPGGARGPEFPLLFGTTNGVVSLPDGDAVYETVANILTNLTVSPDVANDFFEHLQGNWGKNSQTSQRSPMIQDPGRTMNARPMSSIGFARVSLGRDRFGRYASERMTRMLIHRIMTQHEDDEVRSGVKPQEQAIAELVARDRDLAGGLVSQFLNDCSLNEGSTSNNQVIYALRSKQKVEEIISAVQTQVDERVADPQKIIAQFQGAWAGSSHIRKESGGTKIPAVRDVILLRAQEWAAEIQARVLDSVVHWVATQGLRVTLEVVRQAATVELAKEFPAELRGESVGTMNEAKDAGVNVQKLIDGAKLRRGIPKEVRGALKDLVRVQVEAITEGDLREVSAVVLEDMAANLFGPILKALGAALEQVDEDYGGPAFALLSGETVPSDLVPPKNEKLVDEVSTYPDTYVRLVTGTAGSEVAGAVKAFSGEIGDETRRHLLPSEQRAWLSSQQWAPNLSSLGASGAATAAPARPSFSFGVSQVQQRCAAWMTEDSTSAVGRHMNETLRGYLTAGTATEQEKRARSFARLLDDAFDAAKPFVELNSTWLTSEFGYQVAYNFDSSKIPLVKSDNANAFQTIDLALAKHIPNPDTRGGCYSTSQLGDIEIYSALNPFCPSGAMSLSSPIVSSYKLAASARTAGMGDGFWTMRRSRPLLESIPLPRTSQLTIVRGWITAQLADVVSIDEKKRVCSISIDGKRHNLLSPPLGEPKTRWDWLGMALESALLAQMLAATNDPGPFDALHVLLRLGSPDGVERASASYGSPNPVLDSRTPPGLHCFGSNGDEPGDLKSAMEGLVAAFGDLEYEPSTAWRPVPYACQLAPLIAEAAQQLLDVEPQIGGTYVPPDFDSLPGS